MKTDMSSKIKLRKSGDRGHFDHGWLKTYHTFSFAGYMDPDHMGFRSLRVINEDWVDPGQGFGTHPHADMEILTYVLEGELAHEDSMGNGSSIRPGEVQRMTAGTGITHSEYNHSTSEAVHLLQIWILPERKGLEPGYEQTEFPRAEKLNQLRLIVSRDGREGAVVMHQDVEIYASVLESGNSVTFQPKSGRHVWIQAVRGKLDVNGVELSTGDGASTSETVPLAISGEGEFLLFDLA
jgi:redox-sensitive bicupin YhaK (pirin superfamily)